MFEGKKVILFDIDGTLLDTIGIYNEVDSILIECIGGTPHELIGSERDLFLSKNTKSNIYLGYANYLKKRYHSKFSATKINELRKSIALEYLIHSVDFKEQAEVFIKIAKEKGYKLAITSMTTKWTMNIYQKENKNISKKCDFKKMFDLILLKEDVKEKKPNPEIYQKACKVLNVTEEDCIIIEDSLNGVIAAKNAGIAVINIYDEGADSNREELNKLSDYCISGFPELIKFINFVNS